MDPSKPSTAGAGRQHSYAGLQHRRPTGAPAERWPVTINCAEVTGGTMTEDKIQPNLNEQPGQTKPEREAQSAQKSHATTAAQSGQRATSGRKPRFPQLKEHAAEAAMK